MEATNKQATHYFNLYNRSGFASVNDFYNKPSEQKQRAEFFILLNMKKKRGTGYKVLCGSCHTFTAAWKRGKNLVIELPTRQIVAKNVF